MGEQAELSGPDLGAGIDADTLRPGDKLLGHAKGEAVLLVRLDDEFVAIGATCTPLRRTARRGCRGRRHCALSVASRVFRSANG